MVHTLAQIQSRCYLKRTEKRSKQTKAFEKIYFIKINYHKHKWYWLQTIECKIWKLKGKIKNGYNIQTEYILRFYSKRIENNFHQQKRIKMFRACKERSNEGNFVSI